MIKYKIDRLIDILTQAKTNMSANILRLITPKGKKIDLAIPDDSINASQIKHCLETIDAGEDIPILNILTPKGKSVKIALFDGMTADHLVKIISQIDCPLSKEEETGFWVTDSKNLKGRFHTKKGCMGKANEAINQAQINKDQRKKCDRCKHRDA